MMVTETRLHTFLYNATFPASRDYLIEVAEMNAAPRDILDALGMLEGGAYESVEDVMGQVRDVYRQQVSDF